ncbi:MAG: RNA polymerase sigma factor [Myxococcota bacterium]
MARSDEELMAAYVSGDKRAFAELFKRYAPILHGMARRQMRSEEHARDVVQQTFLHVHRARNDFRQGARLKPWVFTIATNLVREHFRRTGRRPETSYEAMREEAPSVEPSVEPPDLAELQAARLDVKRLRDAMLSLPESQRLVIELHWIQGHPFPEVAKMVGASTSAVKVRAHRGYQKLRTLVDAARQEDLT